MNTTTNRTLISLCDELRSEHVMVQPYQIYL